jgi:hypothetical protein
LPLVITDQALSESAPTAIPAAIHAQRGRAMRERALLFVKSEAATSAANR